MARDLAAGFTDELNALVKRPIVLYEGEFASGFIRLWSGYGELSWNGQTWTGAGHLAQVSQVEETSELQANGIVVSLSGIPTSLLSLVLSEVRQNKPGRVYWGFLTETGEVVSDPALVFDGLLDVPAIEDGAEALTITISYENKLRDLERIRELRYTNESQQALFPGDKGFEFVPSLQEWDGVWGKA